MRESALSFYLISSDINGNKLWSKVARLYTNIQSCSSGQEGTVFVSKFIMQQEKRLHHLAFAMCPSVYLVTRRNKYFLHLGNTWYIPAGKKLNIKYSTPSVEDLQMQAMWQLLTPCSSYLLQFRNIFVEERAYIINTVDNACI